MPVQYWAGRFSSLMDDSFSKNPDMSDERRSINVWHKLYKYALTNAAAESLDKFKEAYERNQCEAGRTSRDS
jgi:hypothetical protein